MSKELKLVHIINYKICRVMYHKKEHRFSIGVIPKNVALPSLMIHVIFYDNHLEHPLSSGAPFSEVLCLKPKYTIEASVKRKLELMGIELAFNIINKFDQMGVKNEATTLCDIL